MPRGYPGVIRGYPRGTPGVPQGYPGSIPHYPGDTPGAPRGDHGAPGGTPDVPLGYSKSHHLKTVTSSHAQFTSVSHIFSYLCFTYFPCIFAHIFLSGTAFGDAGQGPFLSQGIGRGAQSVCETSRYNATRRWCRHPRTVLASGPAVPRRPGRLPELIDGDLIPCSTGAVCHLMCGIGRRGYPWGAPGVHRGYPGVPQGHPGVP